MTDPDTDVSGREKAHAEWRELLLAKLRVESLPERTPVIDIDSVYDAVDSILDRLRSLSGDVELVKALKPFAAVADLYADEEDDGHPIWADCHEREIKALNVGMCRKARSALSAAEAESAGEKKCACGAMSEQDCNDLPSLRHCGGAEATSAPTPAPVNREELARAVDKTADDLDSLSFDFGGDSSQMDAIIEAVDHLRNYATALRTPQGGK